MLHDSPRARCWLEVNTAAILNNLRVTREHMLPDTQLIAVITAAIAASMGTTSTNGFVVRSVRRVSDSHWKKS